MTNDVEIGTIVKFVSSNSYSATIAIVVGRREANYSTGFIPVFRTLKSSTQKTGTDWEFDFVNTTFKTSIIGTEKTHPEYIL